MNEHRLTEHELTAAKFKLGGALVLLAVLCALSLLTGCVKRPDGPTSADGGEHFYVDPLTGCEYLRPYGYGGLTPRIAADGHTHLGCKGVQP